MLRLPSHRSFAQNPLSRSLKSSLDDQALDCRPEVFRGRGWRSLKDVAVQMVESLGGTFSGTLGGSFGSLCAAIWGESAQPRVRWWRDRQGKSGYEIYDPQSAQTHRFETMTQTRAWLESRYYR